MGLDIVVYNKERKFLNSFRAGSYNYFAEFRNVICKNVLKIEDKKIQQLFYYFIFHSDCMGKIYYTKCKKILKGFESKEFKQALFFEYLDDENKYFFESLEDWKNGLKLAIKNKGH